MIIREKKPKQCKVCEGVFIPPRPLSRVCSPECALQDVKNKKQLQATKEWRKEKRVLKEKCKTLSDYEKEAREVFQKFIRLRDEKKPCISCGSGSPLRDASHYLNANQFSGLIFDERNVHASCQKCNRFLGGNLLGYRIGLINRYGPKYVEKLEAIKDENRVRKYTREELIQIKEQYKQKIKELQSK